jgi:hypothetical protein
MKRITAKELTQLCALMLETQPSKYGASDYEVMDNRQYILDALYVIDGRHKPKHAMHSLYTGLWAKYVKS